MRFRYVKRALPYDAEHPRDHIESTRDLMIIIDCLHIDETFLKDLRIYFSSYGILYACKCCRDEHFDYILVEFADFGKQNSISLTFILVVSDQVDRIILDKPHYFNDQELHIMKLTSSNRILMNIKYSSNDNSMIIKDAIDVDDDEKFLRYEYNYKKDLSEKSAQQELSEIDLENEILRLQNHLRKLNEDFIVKRQQLEDDCCEQLRKLNENSNQTHRLQQDLERGKFPKEETNFFPILPNLEYAKLLAECESLKRENEHLNDQYLMAELENFELTSYYEQILSEEKAKTEEYQRMYRENLSSLSPCLKSLSLNSPSPPLPPIPDDD